MILQQTANQPPHKMISIFTRMNANFLHGSTSNKLFINIDNNINGLRTLTKLCF